MENVFAPTHCISPAQAEKNSSLFGMQMLIECIADIECKHNETGDLQSYYALDNSVLWPSPHADFSQLQQKTRAEPDSSNSLH